MGIKIRTKGVNMDVLDVPFGERFVGYWGPGYGNQIPVKTDKEINDFVSEHLGLDNIGISISTFKNGVPYLLFLPFDFDSTKLIEAWRDAVLLYNKFVEKDYSASLTFSGKKGFHVFLEVKPKVYPKRFIRFIQQTFKDLYTLKTMDERIFGDSRRLMRIPGTYHMGGKLCKLLCMNEGKVCDLENLLGFSNTDVVIETSDVSCDVKDIHSYPCIEQIIKDSEYWKKNHPRKSFEPAQPIRYTWVASRLAKGDTEDEIVGEAKSFGWYDWDESITRYQIRHIAGGNYLPYSCKSLREMGFCIIEDCPYKNGDKRLLKELGI